MGLMGRQKVEVRCSDCGTTWLKREDSLVYWKGRCRPCAQRLVKSDPAVRARMVEISRAQAIRRGGVPNARRFTHETASGAANGNWKGGRPRCIDCGEPRSYNKQVARCLACELKARF